jgi:hypothetical protein
MKVNITPVDFLYGILASDLIDLLTRIDSYQDTLETVICRGFADTKLHELSSSELIDLFSNVCNDSRLLKKWIEMAPQFRKVADFN